MKPKMPVHKGGEDYVSQRVTPGLVQAKCFSIVDLGTQQVEYQGKTTPQRKFQITFETQEMGTFTNKETETEQQLPLVIGKKYTLSIGEKSNLRKDIKSRLGKDPEDGFDIFSMAGKMATLQVIEGKNKDGTKLYSNINAILPPMPADNDFPLVNETQLFSLEQDYYSEKEFRKLPEFLKKQIMESPEYENMDKHGEDEDSMDDEDKPFN